MSEQDFAWAALEVLHAEAEVDGQAVKSEPATLVAQSLTAAKNEAVSLWRRGLAAAKAEVGFQLPAAAIRPASDLPEADRPDCPAPAAKAESAQEVPVPPTAFVDEIADGAAAVVGYRW